MLALGLAIVFGSILLIWAGVTGKNIVTEVGAVLRGGAR